MTVRGIYAYLQLFCVVFAAVICLALPYSASADTAKVYLASTSLTTWVVPSDWNSASNTIYVIGGGAAGTSSATGGGGGGGGAFARIANLSLTPGSEVTYQVGAGGVPGVNNGNAGDTYFNGTGSTCAAQSVCAKGGTSGNPGIGGSSLSSIGTVTFPGGDGGVYALDAGGGGGGAAGPRGGGGNGGDGSGTSGGGGGGGSGFSSGGTTGGGNNAGLGGGTAGNPGTDGGGGGGNTWGAAGGVGGNGTELGPQYGAGGGGGASGHDFTGKFPSGGLYGGGGASKGDDGNGSNGDGAQGLIAIFYENVPKRTLRLFARAVQNRLALEIPRGNVTEVLNNFPVYIDLSTFPQAFWSVAPAGCGDIRIYASDGTTELPREVVACNTGAKTGEVWFKPSFLYATSSNNFYVSYGTGSADYATTSAFGAQNVWSSNNFTMVHHFNDSAANNQVLNSVAGPFATSSANTSSKTTTGKIGSALFFNGTSDVVYSTSTTATTTVPYTVDMWINVTAFSTSTARTFVGSRSPLDNSFDLKLTGNTLLHGDIGDGTTFITSSADFAIPSTTINTWYHIVYVVTSTGYSAYLNSTSLGSGTAALTNAFLYNSTHRLVFGASAANLGEPFWGSIDEARISNTARSAGWVAAEYLNQTNPSYFYRLGFASPPLLRFVSGKIKIYGK